MRVCPGMLAAAAVVVALLGGAAASNETHCTYDALDLPKNVSANFDSLDTSPHCQPGGEVPVNESCALIEGDDRDNCTTVYCFQNGWDDNTPCHGNDPPPYDGIAVIAVIIPLLTVFACFAALRIKERQAMAGQEQGP
eukprot:TRINITY_DN11157_c0_g1_i2.p1 TRINITY_DN11157_c0_g1~~TRINITY_DN11157_c0_g1_i2.p1  ORF type:complete len:138 (+),score=38.01 TRINITY_DN11157_c0_g1_i2:96-509(+)